MTDTNWPDPNRPGVPMFPDVSARHVLDNKRRKSLKLVFWDHQQEHYCTEIGYLTPLEIVSMDWGYYAPALTPAQINEMLAAERERCADKVSEYAKAERHGIVARHALKTAESEIRNLGSAS
ncbi:hypothetical protein FKW31_03150 [Acetobacter sp. DmW_136]|uniref:hypothetical protein n=1 Tax=Acetobacter sp. DmW_136 TaxID=2591091 RepID=UPI00123AA499|nr:hypothetical protein [Acetobacter sp. DmW_136]KAA8387656.1 hypothetical protein FKW31_03150 [Acetobacter sp. DmW_136]